MLSIAPGSAWFLPAIWSLAGSAHPFGVVRGQLPEFLHVFAFSLLTAAALRVTSCAAWASCAAWRLIDSLFELGQHPTPGPVPVATTSGLKVFHYSKYTYVANNGVKVAQYTIGASGSLTLTGASDAGTNLPSVTAIGTCGAW